MSFDCLLEGDVDPRDVLDMAEQAIKAGTDPVAIADPVGFDGPSQAAGMARELRRAFGATNRSPCTFTTPAVWPSPIAQRPWITEFASSMAAGRVGRMSFRSQSDREHGFRGMVFLCKIMGLQPNIDIGELLAAREVVAASMPDEPLHNALARAGLPMILEDT